MLKNNKKTAIITSLLTLLPILIGLLLWDQLPDTLAVHWGADNAPDGFSSKHFAVFVMPLIMLAIHILCLFLTNLDKKSCEQNKKALAIMFWIFPVVSTFACSMIYLSAMDKAFDFYFLIPILLGFIFIFLGNYLPKTTQNKYYGIKLPWTFANEENWNKTHRLGGKLWFFGGIVIILTGFLSEITMVTVLIFTVFVMVLVPTIYSYLLYKKHKSEGIEYNFAPKNKTEKVIIGISAILLCAVLIFVAVIMFTGDINVTLGDEAIVIEADFWDDATIAYDVIDSIEYKEDVYGGMRTYGFGSPRLSMGRFKNEFFGNYTRYCYTQNKDMIVITSGENILTLNCKNEEQTKSLYNELIKIASRNSTQF